MNKTLKSSLFIFAILIISAIPGRVTYATEKDFVITEDGTLSKYTGSDTVVTVPDTMKVIGSSAFSDRTFIEEIIIPEGVTRVEYGAFYGCINLKKVSFPSTLTTIEDCVFTHCSSLKEVTIPKSVTLWDMYDDEGYYEDGIESYIVDPENTRYSSIDGIVYNKDGTAPLYYPYNKKDETYTLPDSVTDITQLNLRVIKHLKHIVFNSKVTVDLDAYALTFNRFFNGSLERFTVPESNETFCDIDGVLFTKDRKILLAYPENKSGEVYRIPEGTERIFTSAFGTRHESTYPLKYLLFPSSIRKIDACATWIYSFDDSCPNKALVLFGAKGSAVETYAKENETPFSSYDPLRKGSQLLLTASDLSLTPKATAKLAPVFLSTATGQAFTWSSSKSSVVSVDREGNISAKKLGTAVINATTKNGLKAACTVTVKLPAPSDIRIVKGSSSGVELTWKKIPAATSYTIYRLSNYQYNVANQARPYRKLATTTKLSFTDRNVKEASEYDYVIIANHTNSSYNSDYSAPCYLYIPYNVKSVAVTQGKNGVELSWSTDDYSFGVIIYRATSKNGKYRKIQDQVSDNASFTDRGVKAGTTYYYKIQSYYAYDDVKIYTGYSDPVSIKVK